MRRRVASCFVAVDHTTGEIAGLYTLAATGIALDKLPDDIARCLPRYPVVPAGLLGRLAVSTACRGRGIGTSLLADAIRRVAAADLLAFALIVDAKDEAAQRFYERFGFTLLVGEAARLALPIATALPILRASPR